MPTIRPKTLVSLLNQNVRHSTTVPSTPLIKTTNFPAPHAGTIKVLSLNRPPARNAISLQLLAELSKETKALRDEGDRGPTRAVIIASEVDSCFCAGADLKPSPRTQDFLTSLRQTLQDLEDLPIPTIAAIAGAAFGGGLELALPLDFRVLASTATLALPETRLGIIPGAGGTYRLQRLIGIPRARDLILTGRRIGGPEAYFLGIADRLVEVTEEVKGKAREMVLEVALRLGREIAEGAPLAERAAKKAIREASWEAESRAYDEVVGTEDRNEALAAFREKRKPVFKGR
ncbi:hypothetical protein GP486_000236 [Trichoglossum hirsutum]|uniref:Enoyl-CoA hydratase n=1 Tax=Trichoglossum hirsutum TaxID=265104 RepID=A0A9P8LJC0_9PEZI|nr:hypothetical protein GP486_000236 [Trichoglossum hirsutum]